MLEGKTIWLTRPAGQADNLTSILEEKKNKDQFTAYAGNRANGSG